MKSTPLAKRVPHLPATPYHYAVGSMTVIIPPGNPYANGGGDSSQLDNTPQTNPTTDAGAALGRVLFYENLFSINNSISCGSCHKQQNGFADVAPVSSGFQGQKGTRNAPALANENMGANFFWDGRANTLESQAIMPVQNHAELGMESLDNLNCKRKLQPTGRDMAIFFENRFAAEGAIWISFATAAQGATGPRVNEALFWGAEYHFLKPSRWDPFVSFTPGVGLVRVGYYEGGELKLTPYTAVPLGSLSVGCNYYVGSIFHFFLKVQGVVGQVTSVMPTPSLGLNFSPNIISRQ